VNIERKENFVDENCLDVLLKQIQVSSFPWYICSIDTNYDKFKQFCHIFYINKKINSDYIKLIEPILNNIKYKNLHRVKLNLIPKTNKIVEHPFHTDSGSDKLTTSLFYLNTNNGYTKFKNKKIIKSKRNRLVTFASNMLHHGTSCTNEEFRLTLNIVYE
jgi:hypothetical protein